MQQTVLLVDNNEKALDVYGRSLEREGYRVERAGTLARARAILATVAVDVLIADVRMENDDDALDISGVLFLEELAASNPALARIVLTSAEYTPYAIVRRLGDAHPVGKLEGVEILLDAVREAFQKKVALNWELQLSWGSPESARQIATLIEPELPGAALDGRADEIHRALAVLFRHCAAVHVERLVAAEAGRALLAVTAHTPAGIEEPCLLVCGLRPTIARDEGQYDSHQLRRGVEGVPDRIGVTCRTHLGAIAYRLDGSYPADLVPLRNLVPVADRPRLAAVTVDLFDRALRSWHARDHAERDGPDLTAFLRLRMNPLGEPPDAWRQRIAALCAGLSHAGLARAAYAQGQLTLEIDHVQAAFPDPVARLFDADTLSLGGKTAWGFLHGALDLDSVLVDRGGRTWLADLRALGEGPLLWDFARLETAVCLAALAGAPLGEADALCRLLIRAAADRDDEGDTAALSPAAAWAFEWCSRIGGHADRAVDWGSYTVGLLASAAEQLGHFPLARPGPLGRRALLSYGHALLRTLRCLQVLDAARQGQSALPEASRRGLHVDAAGACAYVEGQPLALSKIEFKLVAYLYEHCDKVCRHEQIYQAVWGNTPELRDTRLTTTLDRVRERISRLSDRSYIVTQRGFGYRLIPAGVDEAET
jgi:DNA-binding response OmpR family regulator